LHQRALIEVRLPHLQNQEHQRDHNGDAADEAAE
jgi:hypothetical protein